MAVYALMVKEDTSLSSPNCSQVVVVDTAPTTVKSSSDGCKLPPCHKEEEKRERLENGMARGSGGASGCVVWGKDRTLQWGCFAGRCSAADIRGSYWECYKVVWLAGGFTKALQPLF